MELLVVSRQQLPSSCVSSSAASECSLSSCVSSAMRSFGPAIQPLTSCVASLSSCVSSFAAPSVDPAISQSINLPACSSRSPIGSAVFWPGHFSSIGIFFLFYTSSLSIFEEMSSVNSRPLCTKRVQFPLSNDAMFFCGPLVQGRSGRLWQCACSCRADLVRSGLFRQRACFMQLRHDHFGVDLSISTPSTGCII